MEILEEAVAKTAQEQGWQPPQPLPLVLEPPPNHNLGDFATPVALGLAKAAGKKPRPLAEDIKSCLQLDPKIIQKVEVAGAGYLNFFLNPAQWQHVLPEIHQQGEQFGRSQPGRGKKVQLEFVSANPTGPLHVGHGRGAAVGDALANLLAAVGFKVWREFYINDAGSQIQALGASVWAQYQKLQGIETPSPENGYQGDYIQELAREAVALYGRKLLAEAKPAVATLSDFACRRMLKKIESDLEDFGVHFDQWFSEKSLYATEQFDQAMALLRQRGYMYEQDGAWWFTSTQLGDDKDRVLIRQNQEPTYYASDVAYMIDKYRRGYDTLIYLLGADHHGYILRMKALAQALGYPPDSMQVLLINLVKLLREGQPVPMSKRAGEYVTMEEVVREVGKDAARFIFLSRGAGQPLDFDLELAKKQSPENPVYYVQYAHARLCSIGREAEQRGVPLAAADLTLLQLPQEIELLKKMAYYPEIVIQAALHYEPHRLVYYLLELAALFHGYYNQHRILLAEDLELSKARFYFSQALKIIFASALAMLGVSAPQRMEKEELKVNS
jgi:arginyl-tRNA synthetase